MRSLPPASPPTTGASRGSCARRETEREREGFCLGVYRDCVGFRVFRIKGLGFLRFRIKGLGF